VERLKEEGYLVEFASEDVDERLNENITEKSKRLTVFYPIDADNEPSIEVRAGRD